MQVSHDVGQPSINDLEYCLIEYCTRQAHISILSPTLHPKRRDLGPKNALSLCEAVWRRWEPKGFDNPRKQAHVVWVEIRQNQRSASFEMSLRHRSRCRQRFQLKTKQTKISQARISGRAVNNFCRGIWHLQGFLLDFGLTKIGSFSASR